ncbi:MAG: fasciclin domain-containing protein [Bacteroidota bacterium]
MFAVSRLLLVCLLATAAAGLLFVAGCDNADSEALGDNLFAVVAVSEDLEVLEDLIDDLDLASTLRTGSGDLTFFAPTNEALNGLGEDMIGLLGRTVNQDVLTKLLRRHLVPGRILLADLQDGQVLEPLDGPPLEVRVEDGDDDEDRTVTVGGGLVAETSVEAGNGVVHLLGDLVRDHLTLAERLRVTPLLSDFADFLDVADLNGLVASGEPRTLLVPINSAFDALGPARLQTLERFGNRSVLGTILRHHVLPGRLQADDLEDGVVLEPLDGEPLPVRAEGGLTFVGEARVIIEAVEAIDGLIYLLDTVVLSHLSLAERLQIEPQLMDFYDVFGNAGLLGTLGSDETFTLFVPTDPALEPLGEPFIDELQLRADLQLRTAQYHVVPGRLEPDDLMMRSTPLTTLGDYSLQVQTLDDVGGTRVFVGGRGEVTIPPIETRNGLIYSISPFILPPDLDLEERAVFGALYSFLNTMRSAGLTPLLRGEDPRGEGPYTVFAPTDVAFNGVILPSSTRRRTMEYHIVPGLYEIRDLIDSTVTPTIPDSLFFRLPTLGGPDLRVYPGAGIVRLNCTEVPIFDPDTGEEIGINLVDCTLGVTANQFATNGVIHSVGSVLDLPE